MTVATLLSEVERWLAGNAPRTLSMLRPPATPEQLRDLETQLGFALHPAVATILRWHDGTEEHLGGFELAPTYWLLSADSVAGDAHSWRQLVGKDADDDLDMWQHSWVPIGADRCGGYLVVDHTDSRTFLWEPENGMHARGIWPTPEELCTELRVNLLNRAPWLGCVPTITDGGVEWTDNPARSARSTAE